MENTQRASCFGPLLLTALSVAYAGDATQPRSIDEYRVKAQYLFSLSKFITWPNEHALRSIDPLYICVYGDNPLKNYLDQLGQHALKSHPVVVRQIEEQGSPLGCQILFVPGDAIPQRLVSGELAAAGVLTVGENEEFLRQGGLVSLLAGDNAIHIALNYRDAKRAGFTIDAGLLDVARKVDWAGGGSGVD
jgi:hypothetical protein